MGQRLVVAKTDDCWCSVTESGQNQGTKPLKNVYIIMHLQLMTDPTNRKTDQMC